MKQNLKVKDWSQTAVKYRNVSQKTGGVATLNGPKYALAFWSHEKSIKRLATSRQFLL